MTIILTKLNCKNNILDTNVNDLSTMGGVTTYNIINNIILQLKT